jgi:hypothetical protein
MAHGANAEFVSLCRWAAETAVPNTRTDLHIECVIRTNGLGVLLWTLQRQYNNPAVRRHPYVCSLNYMFGVTIPLLALRFWSKSSLDIKFIHPADLARGSLFKKEIKTQSYVYRIGTRTHAK